MKTRKEIHYWTIDKSFWTLGPWDAEPDKVQWIDTETGLPCIARRVPHSGAWCGYVGVTEDHPLFGKDYDECDLNVHGGITFAAGCQNFDALYADHLRYEPKARKEMERFPKGDAAQFISEWGDLLSNRDEWQKRAEATAICHTPNSGESDNVWWFGFDCAHYGDRMPGHEATMREIGVTRDYNGEYRTLEFVRNECKNLAHQLAKVIRDA